MPHRGIVCIGGEKIFVTYFFEEDDMIECITESNGELFVTSVKSLIHIQ